MKIREISILKPEAMPSALDALRSNSGILMLQMPSVYVLLSSATKRGVEALNSTKRRLPKKNYGTAIGSLSQFHALALPGVLPDELATPQLMNCMTGGFIRYAVQNESFNSPVIRNGTHQGLLVEGKHRSLFRAIESEFKNEADPELFGGKNYTAPLCTSANLSGDPLGSITDWERAYNFAKITKIPLIIRCEDVHAEEGSYPIFYFRQNKVTVERHGPGLQEIKERLPVRLFH